MTEEEVATLVAIANEASGVVQSIYQRGFRVEYKGPSDPVTEADKAANELICERLSRAFPGTPIVAEESAPETFADFRSSERIFFVDPVDGTREFVERNDQFVVMLGLVEGDTAVVGIIQAPTTGEAWVGVVGAGAYRLARDGTRTPIRVSGTRELARAHVVSSRSHRTHALERALSSLGAAQISAVGSAGLKGARVATGEADVYVAPHYAGKRWDICPTDALVVAAGGRVTDARGKPMDYRGESLSNDLGIVLTNGALHAEVLERLARARVTEASLEDEGAALSERPE